MVIPVEDILHLILMFFFYSFLGWCMEVVLKYIQLHRFVNRGFYTGPVCPIYGSGAVLITLVVQWLSPLESAVGTTFAISFLLCGALEYRGAEQRNPAVAQRSECFLPALCGRIPGCDL